MEAVVTLKLRPAQFDLVRDALRLLEEESRRVGKDTRQSPAAKRAANAKALSTQALLREIG